MAPAVLAATVVWAQPGNPDPDPDPGTHTAPVTTTVSITYDEFIDAATVTSRTFAVHGMHSGLVTATHSVQDGSIIAAPINPFYAGELVQATATTHTTSITGEHPLAPTVWQFRTAADVGSDRFFYGNNFGTGSDNTKALALGDVDGDGDLDLAVGNDGYNVVYFGDGDGSFDTISAPVGSHIDYTQALATADMDGDGMLDLAVGNTGSGGGQNAVYFNQLAIFLPLVVKDD